MRALTKKGKIKSKGVGERSRDLLSEFWDILHISATVETRNIKLGRRIVTMSGTNEKCKTRSKGVEEGSCDLLLDFLERLMVGTSNLARIQTTRGTNEKLAQNGQGAVTLLTFRIVGSLPYLADYMSNFP